MARDVDRDEVQRLVREGAQLIEVLSREEYEHWHIQGAKNLPLKSLNRQTAEVLDRNRPIIVYCSNYQ